MEYDARKVTFITPKDKLMLNGLWLGPKNPKRVFIYLHGLSGSMFDGRQGILTSLISKTDSVLIFNNRGSGIVNRFSSKKKDKVLFGAASEVFTECIDDIDGAISYAKKYKPKEIVLVGHSTGCQKSVYWAYKKKNHGLVKSLILLAPMSDYAGTPKRLGISTYKALLKEARMLMKKGKGNQLLSNATTEIGIVSAQRFISLYTPESTEEIFSYANPSRKSKTLSGIKLPMHIVFAEKDEWMDRSLSKILEWFEANVTSKDTLFSVIKGADHGFHGKDKEVISHIKKFLD